MRSTVPVVVVLVTLAIQSCAKQEQGRPIEQKYVAAVRAISHFQLGSFEERRERAKHFFMSILLTHDSVAELRRCFWAVEEFGRPEQAAVATDTSESEHKRFDHLRPGEAADLAQMVVVNRVAILQSSDAGQFLVELLIEPRVHWDGEDLGGLEGSIVYCGRVCIPFLERIQGDQKTRARELIERVNAGRDGP